ncbi:class I SAM-dependent methyltransferase [Thermodesulfobacteriota bacterium]
MMYEKSLPGTVHLGYQYNVNIRLREKILCELTLHAISLANASKSSPSNMDMDFVSLDIGCGSGHLLKACSERGLQIEGADFDPVCVKLSERFAKTRLIGDENLQDYFEERSFDCVVFSHSLEHFDSPLDAVQQAKRISRRFLILAIPNPCRLQTVLIINPLRYDYSNLGHLCCWDRSHFTVFLTQRCGLKILKWGTYKMGIISLLPTFLKALKGEKTKRQRLEIQDIEKYAESDRKKRFSPIVRKAFEPLEVAAGRMFPYLADELFVLTEISENERG